jgi:hypothetical protein
MGGMQDATAQMNKWKDKLTGGNSNATTADFRPNPYHNRTFFQRIQLGLDMQTQSSTNLVPALSTLGVSAGYLLNSRSIVGAAAGFKLGWGQPFNHIAFSGQGASLRGFFHWRWKYSLWLCGGYEANYYNVFDKIASLKNINAWQISGLAGLMKTYRAGKRTGNIQLLYDLLHAQHMPQSAAFIFRVGYSFH